MENFIRDQLYWKSKQLVEKKSVRCMNAVNSLFKENEEKLVPLLFGNASALSIPKCGKKTALEVEEVLNGLRPYYEELIINSYDKNMKTGNGNAETQPTTVATPQKKQFDDVSEEVDRLIQHLYRETVGKIGEARLRHIIDLNIPYYRDIETVLNKPLLIRSWNGAGRHSAMGIERFVNTFYDSYKKLLSKGELNLRKQVVALDYPFLTPKQCDFVAHFHLSNGHYPQIFIAYHYFQTTTFKKARIYALANGIGESHPSLETIARDYDISRERARQISMMSVTNDPESTLVWQKEYWQRYDFMKLPLLTVNTIGWEKLCKEEQVEMLEPYSLLYLLRQMAPVTVVALKRDGARANSRRTENDPWKQPTLVFAYDTNYSDFRFEKAIAEVAHQANLQKIVEQRASLSELVDRHFAIEPSPETRSTVIDMMSQLLPMMPDVEVEGNEIVFTVNHTNYCEEIYQIIKSEGKPTTVDRIFELFRQRLPDDHHTNDNFIRSYLLHDKRFEAVGSKSTYQLREWGHFAGTIADLAVRILSNEPQPIIVEELTRRIMAERQNTTVNSIYTTIYLTVCEGRLNYYIDNEADREAIALGADDKWKRYYVGLGNKKYNKRFWLSPHILQSAVASLKRFISEEHRLPFIRGRKPIEKQLAGVMRRFMQRRASSAKEQAYWDRKTANIQFQHYPHNERELLFIARCTQLKQWIDKGKVWGKDRGPKDMSHWFRTVLARKERLSEFERYQLSQFQLSELIR